MMAQFIPAGQHPLQPLPHQLHQPQQPQQPQQPPQQPQQPAGGGLGGFTPNANPFQQQQIGGHYRAFYNDETNDPFHGNYQNAYNEFVVPFAGQPPNVPAELANKVYMAADQGLPMSLILLHPPPPNAPVPQAY
jgi:hypothetical protein